MTVSSTTRKVGPFNGNGLTTAFPFTFKCFTTADIQLTHTSAAGVQTVLTLGTHYTVSLNADQDNNPGGTITYPASGTDYLETGEVLAGVGVLSATQGADITNAGRFNAQVFEDALDKLTILIQQLEEKARRALLLPVSEIDPDALPLAEDRAGGYLAFDADGNPVPSAGTGNDSALRTDLAAGGGAALVGFTPTGTGAAVRSMLTKMRGLYVAPEDFGAVGNNSDDDTTAFTNALAAGHSIYLTPFKTYRFTGRITVPSGQRIVGDRSSIMSMDTGSGFFDQTSTASYDAVDGVGFYLSGNTGGGLFGFRIRLSNRTAELIAGAVLMRGCTATHVVGCEFDNFSKAKIVRVESCIASVVDENYFHDCQISSATTGQLTCIDVDDNRPTGASTGISIQRNRFKDITASAGFITAYGYQTDAINISHEDSGGHTIVGNYADVVGEGIDVFGAECTVSGNTVRNAYNVGIKLIHGARRNTVTGNIIARPGLGGIVIAGSSGDTNNTENNTIVGNTISRVNEAGNWTASSTYGIKLEDDGGAKFARKNLIADNSITDGAAMKYGILADNSSASNIIRNNLVDSFTIAEFSASVGATYTFKSAKAAEVQAYQSAAQSIGTGAFTAVQFQTETVDAQSEFDASTTYTASCPRTLMFHAKVRTGGASAGKVWELEIQKNGTPTARTQVVSSGTDLSISITDVIDVVRTDTVAVYVKHNEAGSVNLTNTAELTNLRIVETK